MIENNANREYKNSLFIDYFTDEDKLIEIYSAIIGESVKPGTEVRINTLSDVLFRGLINDVSFLLGGRLIVLIEHQSTLSENLPLRMLQYYVEVLKRHFINNDADAIYKEQRLKIPRPEFIVLYNGRADSEDQMQLKLSDAFEPGNTKEHMDLTVTIYNINPGHNEEILAHSRALKGYSSFIGKIHEYISDGMSREDAIKYAILYSRENDIMQEYLPEHEGEVIKMLTAEWNLDDALRVRHEEGKAEERIGVARKMKAKGYSNSDIAEITGLPLEKIEEIAQITAL
jgi:predicted transposase/invertase (TIGR01784 family)